MKVEFYHTKGKEISSEIFSSGRFTFTASRPIVIQPSEIMKVQTDLVVRVPKDCVLSIVTAHDLFKRTGELFPSNLVLTSIENDFFLELAVRNCGRSQLNILPDQKIALGFVSRSVDVEVGTFDLNKSETGKEKSKSSKNNQTVKFEMR